MGNGDDRTLILLQMLLQPVDAFGVKVVRRLVEQQHIGLLKEQTAECDAATLSTRKVRYRQIALWTAQCIHRTVQSRVDVPGICCIDDILQFSLSLHQFVHLVGIRVILLLSELHVDVVVFFQCIIDLLYAFHDILFHGLCLVERRILRQIAHRVAGTPYHLTLCRLHQSGDDLHQRGLSGTIETDNAYLCTIKEREVNVLQDLFLILRDDLRHPHH